MNKIYELKILILVLIPDLYGINSMSALVGCRYVTTYVEWPPCLI